MLLMLAAFLFFAPKSRRQWLWMLCAALLSISVVLSKRAACGSRSPSRMAYLIWRWRRWVILLLPVVAALVFVASPAAIRERFQSIVHAKTSIPTNFTSWSGAPACA